VSALAVLWRRLDRPGHEVCRLAEEGPGWLLSGNAVFAHEGRPCRLDYSVRCNAGWRTASGTVRGFVGDRAVEVDVACVAGRWTLNEADCPEAAGCVDLDLNFSPSTNLLPIRRLGLPVGAEARVRAAWLRFPGFTLEPLEQVYRRTAPGVYGYESAGGRFMAELDVDENGFVRRYPGFCEADA
jgi:hypothetical protein